MKNVALLRYEEQVPATWWLRAVLLISLAAMIGALIGPAFDGPKSRAWYISYYPVMALAAAAMAFSLFTFRRLSIAVTDEKVTFGFGILRKTLPLESIRAYEAKKYNWLRYGGWGIRFSLGGRRAYSLPGTPRGVEVIAGQGKKERRYFVSSRYPDRFAAAIGGEMSAPSATWQ